MGGTIKENKKVAKGIFFCIPGYGHVNPTLAMVKELVERGEQIDYCCTEEFRAPIERTGATFIPFPLDIAYPTQEFFNVIDIFANIMEDSYNALPILGKMMEDANYDYLLVDIYTPWGRILANHFQLPIMVFFPSFAIHKKIKEKTAHSFLQFFSKFGMSIKSGFRLRKFYKKLQEKYTLPKGGFVSYLDGALDIPCITFTSREFQPSSEIFPSNYLFTGPNINVEVANSDSNFPYEKLEGKKVIYISLGSVVVSRQFLETCIIAFSNTDFTVVLNVSKVFKKEDFTVPDNFILCSFAPQIEILSRASLFLTHGGMNSTHEGIYFEVPLIVFPQGGDQFMVAQAVVQNKLGLWLNSKKVSPEKLLNAANQVLEDVEIKNNIKAMSQSLKKAGGYKRAADEVQLFIQQSVEGFN